MNVRATLASVVALSLAFGAGVAWQSWRATEALKAHPCSVTVWDPNDQHFTSLTLDVRNCLKLGPPRELSVVWVDDPYSAKFTPDRPGNLPASVDLSLPWPERTRLYWLAGLSGDPPQFSGRTFHVSVVGRLANRACCWTDVQQYTIVVENVLSARLEAKP
jgi:hypothetical protein